MGAKDNYPKKDYQFDSLLEEFVTKTGNLCDLKKIGFFEHAPSSQTKKKKKSWPMKPVKSSKYTNSRSSS